ncbi:glycosyltransferase [Sodalis praecaptivus]|uniref:glycosyltransferase n=1 Tax=Sodalis praecaptivus TaxID=1239307 RepID=UPI0027FA8D05|nr:glycosyltransferase [Sodalis praecaptivus]CAJ0998104.1 D-inositol-3-phosphate glycosyltransferase [Sodalis praecaptivus]
MADRLRHLGLQFLVVGDGPQRHRLEAEVAHYGLQAQFVITGFIPNDQVATAIAACRVIVMPSEHEEFGGVSIEAAAVGTPVAAYAVGGIKEILGKIPPPSCSHRRVISTNWWIAFAAP